MKQSDSALHFNRDRTSVMIPCGCGDEDDRLHFYRESDPDLDEVMLITASIEGAYGWKARIASAWRALTYRQHHDSVILSKASVVELRDWLTETLVWRP